MAFSFSTLIWPCADFDAVAIGAKRDVHSLMHEERKVWFVNMVHDSGLIDFPLMWRHQSTSTVTPNTRSLSPYST